MRTVAALEGTPHEPASNDGVVGNLAILVVDDDPSIGKMLSLQLSAAGYDVTLVTNGHAAFDAVMQGDFALIISDIQMPGMNGVELLRRIRRCDRDVPVILMTCDPRVETAVEAIALGALQYLSKPIRSAELHAAVEKALRLRSMARMKREAVRILEDEGAQPGDRVDLEARLDRAVSTMWIAFQPIVDAQRSVVYGYEALMRSRELSLPHPGAILDAAVGLGRLPEIGRRVRDLAAAAFADAPADAALFVNLHTSDLLDETLYDDKAALAKIAGRVVLEVTERAAIDGVTDAQTRVRRLRELGFRIAIDDLGAGYAGLSSFAALEPEVVKLDMSLVRNAHQSAIRRRLIASMTGLCREMGMLVVAEGVEASEECDTVLDAGCDLLQGYLFAKPGPPFPRVERLR